MNGRRRSCRDVDGIIAACLGLHLEAVTEKPVAQPGENLTVQVEAINRSPVEVKLQSVQRAFEQGCHAGGKTLAPNELLTRKGYALLCPDDLPFSQPYWLREPGTIGTYAVSEQTLIGRPENPPPVSGRCHASDRARKRSPTRCSRVFAKSIGSRAK